LINPSIIRISKWHHPTRLTAQKVVIIVEVLIQPRIDHWVRHLTGINPDSRSSHLRTGTMRRCRYVVRWRSKVLLQLMLLLLLMLRLLELLELLWLRSRIFTIVSLTRLLGWSVLSCRGRCLPIVCLEMRRLVGIILVATLLVVGRLRRSRLLRIARLLALCCRSRQTWVYRVS
jgi:hypothetical protein